jgi:hypothetical protein
MTTLITNVPRMRRATMLVFVGMIGALAAPGVQPGPGYTPAKLDLYTATSDLWRTDKGFQTAIHLKNMLVVSDMDVILTLYMMDGTPYRLPVVHLGKSAVASVSVNAALAAAPAAVQPHISQSGSAALEYRYDWAGAVTGMTVMVDTPRSLQHTSEFVFPDQMSAAMRHQPALHTAQGMWWKYSAASGVYLSVANTGDAPATANVAVFDARKHALGTHQVSLPAHGHAMTTLDDLIGSSPAGAVGGIEIAFTGGENDLVFSGGIEDDHAGYSARVPLAMAMMAGSDPQPATCTMASAGLMAGVPDPMEGFPRGVSFSLYGFARNTGSTPIALQGLANYMDKAGPHSIPLASETLAPGQALNLHLDRAARLPFQDGMVNVSYTYNAPCGNLLLSTGSVDATGNYVFEVQAQAVGKTGGRVSTYWEAGRGIDTMYSLWNPSSEAEDLRVSIFYDQQGSVYQYPLHLDANASTMISMLELIRMGKPDETGQVIPAGARMGSLRITGPRADLTVPMTLVMSGGVYNPVAGTCYGPCITCTGAVKSYFVPASFSVAVGNSTGFSFMIGYSDGSDWNYTSSATYSSNSYISVTAGSIKGLAAGSTGFSASVSSGVPEYVTNFCLAGGSCPTGGYGGGDTGTVTQ